MPQLLTLGEAAKLLHDRVTVSALRKAGRDGRLSVIRLGGRDYTTQAALDAMLAAPSQPRPKCPDQAKEFASISGRPEATGERSITSGMDRARLAQSAALISLTKLTKNSPSTSRGTTKWQKTSIVPMKSTSPKSTEYAPSSPSKLWLKDMCGDLLRYWEGKRLSDITRKSCDDYVEWRTAQPLTTTDKRTISKTTARLELGTLRAALNFFRAEHAPTLAMPPVKLPKKSPPREGYFLDRTQLARRLRAAWRRPETRHIARLILLGIYSGSRLNTMLRLRWVPSIDTGWIDLDRENPIIHRRGTGEEDSKKRRPPCLVHRKLLPHLRRWKAQDLAAGVVHVISFKTSPIRDPSKAWEKVRIAAGSQTVDGPHVLRHSCVTLFVKAKAPLVEIAAFTGMTTAVLERYYLHQTLADQENIAQTTHQKRARNGSKRA